MLFMGGCQRDCGSGIAPEFVCNKCQALTGCIDTCGNNA